MKLGTLLLFVVLFAGSSSCMWGDKNKQKAAITKDTLAYTYQTIHERASDCGDKPDSGCTVIKIKYPFFKESTILSDTISKKLINLLPLDDVNTTTLDLKIYSQSFLAGYAKAKKQNKNEIGAYKLNGYAKILRQDSSLTTLEINGEALQSGFRLISSTCFINWNTKTNKSVLLADILVNGYQDKLTEVADSIFRKQEKLSPTASLAKDYLFKNNKFALNDNYSITPLGIRFIYNTYEIKPFNAGQTDLLIPYSQIKSLLRPNTVVSQYHK